MRRRRETNVVTVWSRKPPFPAGSFMGGTGLERRRKCGIFFVRGVHAGEHRMNTFEQRGSIDLPVVDKSVRVPIRDHDLRSLPHRLANFSRSFPAGASG